MGDYCGVTVLTIVFDMPSILFAHHSFIIPRVATLHDAGVPTFFHNANADCSGYVCVNELRLYRAVKRAARARCANDCCRCDFSVSRNFSRARHCQYCSSTPSMSCQSRRVRVGGTSRTTWSTTPLTCSIRAST
jgi:hypothetical protein